MSFIRSIVLGVFAVTPGGLAVVARKPGLGNLPRASTCSVSWCLMAPTGGQVGKHLGNGGESGEYGAAVKRSVHRSLANFWALVVDGEPPGSWAVGCRPPSCSCGRQQLRDLLLAAANTLSRGLEEGRAWKRMAWDKQVCQTPVLWSPWCLVVA